MPGKPKWRRPKYTVIVHSRGKVKRESRTAYFKDLQPNVQIPVPEVHEATVVGGELCVEPPELPAAEEQTKYQRAKQVDALAWEELRPNLLSAYCQ